MLKVLKVFCDVLMIDRHNFMKVSPKKFNLENDPNLKSI